MGHAPGVGYPSLCFIPDKLLSPWRVSSSHQLDSLWPGLIYTMYMIFTLSSCRWANFNRRCCTERNGTERNGQLTSNINFSKRKQNTTDPRRTSDLKCELVLTQLAPPSSHPQADFNQRVILLRPEDRQTLTGDGGL